MARIEITVPGERIVEEFTALVQQPVTPTGAPALKVGLVEISQTQPTELIPGPMGPQGPRGSRWFTGAGDPTVPGGVTGDMYLDDVSGAVWQWDGTAWVDTGTNIQGSPDTGPDILAKLAPVDGAGSGLDADTVDGMHAAEFATDAELAAVAASVTAGDALRVLKAGDIMTGSLEIQATSGNSALRLRKAVGAFVNSITSYVTTSARWSLHFGSNETESGANAGSNIYLYRYNDAGTLVDHAMQISRATGVVAMPLGATTATPPPGDNDTSVATTAFVKANTLADAPSDGLTYGRKNATWATIVGGAVISDTPPPGPLTPGQLWWESDTGNTYLWFEDSDGPPGQWVQQNIQPAAVPGDPPLTEVAGTFTPVIVGTTTAGVGTYSTQYGFCSKIGRQVTFHLTVAWSAHTGTGDIRVGGLPHLSKGGSISPCNVLGSALTFSNQLAGAVNLNSTEISIYSIVTNSGQLGVPMDTQATLRIAGTYLTD